MTVRRLAAAALAFSLGFALAPTVAAQTGAMETINVAPPGWRGSLPVTRPAPQPQTTVLAPASDFSAPGPERPRDAVSPIRRPATTARAATRAVKAAAAPARATPEPLGALACRAPPSPLPPAAGRTLTAADLNAFAGALDRWESASTRHRACLDGVMVDARANAAQRQAALTAYNKVAPETERLWGVYQGLVDRFRAQTGAAPN